MSYRALLMGPTRGSRPLLAAVTALTLLAACSDSTGPVEQSGASIRIVPAWIDAFGDEPITLTVEVRDRGGAPVSGAKVTWKSRDPDVVVVDSAGTVRGVSLGEGYITAALPDGTADSAVITITGFSAVAAGASQSCGLVPEGSDLAGVYCWGDNSYGQLGDSSTVNASSPVRARTTQPFASIATGPRRTCALTPQGYAWCWGDTGAVPTAVLGGIRFTTLSNGEAGCGLESRALVWCWRSDLNPTIREGDVLNYSIGQRGIAERRDCWVTTAREAYCDGLSIVGDTAMDSPWLPFLISTGQSLATISTGSTMTCALTTQGAALCWRYGQSGPGAVEVAGGLTFTTLDVDGATACGTTTTQEAYCWGSNESGQLGNGSTTASYQPSRVRGGLLFQSVSVGVRHACGLTISGSIYCWGANDLGQLGDGTTTPSLVPVRVVRPR